MFNDKKDPLIKENKRNISCLSVIFEIKVGRTNVTGISVVFLSSKEK